MKRLTGLIICIALMGLVGCTTGGGPKKDTIITKYDGQYILRYHRTMINGDEVPEKIYETKFNIVEGEVTTRFLNEEKQLVSIKASIAKNGKFKLRRATIGKMIMKAFAKVGQDGSVTGKYAFEFEGNKVEGEIFGERTSTEIEDVEPTDTSQMSGMFSM